MKKTFKITLISLLLILFTTGCTMKVEYGLTISKDKDVIAEILMAYDDEAIDTLLSMNDLGSDDSEVKAHTDAERWAYLDEEASDDDSFKGYEKTKYDKDGLKGYVYKIDLGKIDDLTGTNEDKADLESLEKGSKIFTKDGDVYSLNIKSDTESSKQAEKYASNATIDFKFKVTLPNKAKSNNATEVSKDGLTYTWDLLNADSVDLKFAFGNKVDSKIIIISACVGAVVIIGAVAAVVICKKKKSSK